jgi:predicted KAP-like P-loop ATPase
MWPDNETDKDFLNFSGTTDTVAEIILQANGRPISIGVSGQWGVGKSSMIKLIRQSLHEKVGEESDKKFVFIDFNAWLYQGYDDARAALIDVIAEALYTKAEKEKKGVEKAKEFLKRVNWLRLAKLTTGSAISLAFGLAPIGLIGEAYDVMKKSTDSGVDQDVVKQGEETVSKIKENVSGLLKEKIEKSPPKEIAALRISFEQLLEELGITLVVLIDDLDRCLPETTISTLEAIRLFLFLKNTAFVIAADDKMIKHAVRKHFDGIDDELVTNYFDKLIQIPIRVPALGTQEVRAYMMMLFIETSDLSINDKEQIRRAVCMQLASTWKGNKVDTTFLKSLGITFKSDLLSRFETAERLAHIMTTSSKIAGNPRLIKRFLNALSIRMAISKSLGVGVDEAVLAKLLLFERCGTEKSYQDLLKKVNEDVEGKPRFLSEWEEKVTKGEDVSRDELWAGDFVSEWLAMAPRLGDKDLRGALYVSKEHLPLISPEDRLSSEAADILKALLTQPSMARSLKQKIETLNKPELPIMMDRLLDKARQEQEWGAPDILIACLAIAEADGMQSLDKLKSFLLKLPPSQIKPSIVPRIKDLPWSESIFDQWKKAGVSAPVKKAIEGK